MILTFGTAQRPRAGEEVCGDGVFIRTEDPALVAIADGLGHGPQAAFAARTFLDFVRDRQGAPLDVLLHGATKHIAHTRGVAAGLAQLSRQDRRMWFAGVGNIEVKALSRSKVHPVCSPGIVGRPLRKVMVYDYEVLPGDAVAFMTDGVSSRFDLTDFVCEQTAQQLAERVLAAHGKYSDDATCVVVRVELNGSAGAP